MFSEKTVEEYREWCIIPPLVATDRPAPFICPLSLSEAIFVTLISSWFVCTVRFILSVLFSWQ
jgi:hypothetical protein